MHMASENDPGILVPTEDDDITLESPLSILEAPEPSPRRIRIPRPRLPQRIPEAALLKWGPWVIGIGAGIALLALTLTAIPSWGSIAARDGITLLLAGIGAGMLIWLFYRLHHQWAQRSWLALAASLMLVGILGLALSPTLHVLQGHLLENQSNYQRAIEEYAASGEHSPDGQDIARAYLEWGQRDLRQQNYAAGVQHLEAAAETYSATTAAQQARTPLSNALLLWGRQLALQQNYALAIQQFEHLRTHYANSQAAQQAQAHQDEPGAYYAWGEQLQAQQQFQQALTAYQAVGKLFPTSVYATPAYNGAANDLYTWGQALVKQGKYAQAIAAYQHILKQYSKAPDATKAQQALDAPQKVTGRLIFASGPPDAKVIIRLSSSWSTNANGYVQGGQVYEVHTDANGNFIFPAVFPGRYLVDWQQGSGFTTVLHQGTYNPVYIADVEPLRGTLLGDVQVEAS